MHWSEIVCEGTIGQRCLDRTATALSSLPRTSLDGKHFKENKVKMGFIYFLLMWNYFCPNQVSSAPVNWKINVNQINWHEQHWLNQVLPKSAFNFYRFTQLSLHKTFIAKVEKAYFIRAAMQHRKLPDLAKLSVFYNPQTHFYMDISIPDICQ